MVLRRCERRKSGKRHTYRAVVESYRTARGPRQLVVAYLGELAAAEQDGWAKLLVRGREDVSWGTMAAVRGVARFSQPSSERHSERKWYRRTALEDLLGMPPEELHTDRLHAAPDRLLPHQEALESHLKQRFGEVFELRCDPLLYDVTGTCLAGDAENCEIAKRGYSRDSRGDDLQLCSGPVVTAGGIPLGYEVFAGNMHDSLTLTQVTHLRA